VGTETDLQIRPIYRRLQKRIEAHICIAFCAYKVYKEQERQLAQKKTKWSVEQVIDIAKTIFSVTIKTRLSNTLHTRLYIGKPEQENPVSLFNLKFGWPGEENMKSRLTPIAKAF